MDVGIVKRIREDPDGGLRDEVEVGGEREWRRTGKKSWGKGMISDRVCRDGSGGGRGRSQRAGFRNWRRGRGERSARRRKSRWTGQGRERGAEQFAIGFELGEVGGKDRWDDRNWYWIVGWMGRKCVGVGRGETSGKFLEGRNVAMVGGDGGAVIWRRRRQRRPEVAAGRQHADH